MSDQAAINIVQDIRDLALLVKDARFNGYLPMADFGLINRVEAWLVAWPHPDWSQAPKWAEWWAVDCDGFAMWYEEEPLLYETVTFCGWGPKVIYGSEQGMKMGAGEIEIPLGVDWRTLKEKKP